MTEKHTQNSPAVTPAETDANRSEAERPAALELELDLVDPRRTGRVPSPRRRWGRRAALAVALTLFAGALGLVGVFTYYGRELPNFDALTDYRPPQVSKVFDRNGEPIAEFFRERRTVVATEDIPKVLRDAVVAAEDGNFYEHDGLDYMGILRALLIDLKEMRLAQGASTITQQVIKNIVLSPERSFARKIKEAILARRIEQNLTKDEILALYLNHIYFGHGRYGIGEAARFYFDKAPAELTLGEAALLAGLPQSPGRLSPLRNPERAKRRQLYVLERLEAGGFITHAQAEEERLRPIAAVGRVIRSPGAHYVEEIRRKLLARYGDKQLYEGGLRVEIAMDARLQALAGQAVRAGLEALQKKAGLARPAFGIPEPRRASLGERFRAAIAAAPARSPSQGALQDLADEPDEIAPPKTGWDFAALDAEALRALQGEGVDVDEAALLKKIRQTPLVPGATVLAPLAALDKKALRVDLGGAVGWIDRARLRWARLPKKTEEVLFEGALLRVRVLDAPAPKEDPGALALDLVPMPTMQAALVAIEPMSRRIVALEGGYDFAASQFNRATQARRQPGSSFKPFVYGAALESGRFTAASILTDAPDLYRDPWTGKEWRPQNYERDVFEGPMGLREALSKSKNTISVRLIEAVGPEAVIDFARRAGIVSPLPANLTLGLGTGEVTPLEMANGFATLAAQGMRAEPIFLVQVRDADGKVLEAHEPVSEEVIAPGVTYIVTSFMQSVVETGTGRRAGELRRPVAGKTGTASGNRDAWFIGFTPELVAVVWVGRDNHQPLGHGGTGGAAALPIWLDFMKGALEGVPPGAFAKPDDVEEVRIDSASGLRAAGADEGRAEFFVIGTAPEEQALAPGQADPRFFLMEDDGSR